MSPPVKYYPDSIAGVKQMLKEQSFYDHAHIDRAEYIHDIYIQGCWLVNIENGRSAIAYVATHQWAPDFEEIS